MLTIFNIIANTWPLLFLLRMRRTSLPATRSKKTRGEKDRKMMDPSLNDSADFDTNLTRVESFWGEP